MSATATRPVYRSHVVATRLSALELEAIKAAASIRGEPVSEFVRRIVFANDRVQRALEMREAQ